jgi:hypothetical protein
MLGAILAALGAGGSSFGRSTMREDEQEADEQRRLQEIAARNEEIRQNRLAQQQEAEAGRVRDRASGMASYRLMFPDAEIPDDTDADPRMMAQLQGQKEASIRAANALKSREGIVGQQIESREGLAKTAEQGRNTRHNTSVGVQRERMDQQRDPRELALDRGREALFGKLAAQAVQAAGGDANKAVALLLQDPETANVFSEGMNSRHVLGAAESYKQRQQRSSLFAPPVQTPPQLPGLTRPPGR